MHFHEKNKIKMISLAVSNKLPEPNPPPSEPATSWYVTSAPTKPWKPITGKYCLMCVIKMFSMQN